MVQISIEIPANTYARYNPIQPISHPLANSVDMQDWQGIAFKAISEQRLPDRSRSKVKGVCGQVLDGVAPSTSLFARESQPSLVGKE